MLLGFSDIGSWAGAARALRRVRRTRSRSLRSERRQQNQPVEFQLLEIAGLGVVDVARARGPARRAAIQQRSRRAAREHRRPARPRRAASSWPRARCCSKRATRRSRCTSCVEGSVQVLVTRQRRRASSSCASSARARCSASRPRSRRPRAAGWRPSARPSRRRSCASTARRSPTTRPATARCTQRLHEIAEGYAGDRALRSSALGTLGAPGRRTPRSGSCPRARCSSARATRPTASTSSRPAPRPSTRSAASAASSSGASWRAAASASSRSSAGAAQRDGRRRDRAAARRGRRGELPRAARVLARAARAHAGARARLPAARARRHHAAHGPGRRRGRDHDALPPRRRPPLRGIADRGARPVPPRARRAAARPRRGRCATAGCSSRSTTPARSSGIAAAADWPQLPAAHLLAIDGVALDASRPARRSSATASCRAPAEPTEPAAIPRRSLCSCVHVTTGAVDDAIRGGCSTIAELTQALACGSVCGGCTPRLAERLAEAAWTAGRGRLRDPPDGDRARRSACCRPPAGRGAGARGSTSSSPRTSTGIEVERRYTLTGTPGDPEYEITVKREPLGRFSNWLFDERLPGELGCASRDPRGRAGVGAGRRAGAVLRRRGSA